MVLFPSRVIDLGARGYVQLLSSTKYSTTCCYRVQMEVS